MRDKYKPAATVAEPAPANEGTITVEVDGKPLSDAAVASLNKASEADAALEHLRGQIASLKRSEEIQRKATEIQATQAEWRAKGGPSHQELLDHWEQHHGMPKLERLFLEENPALIDNPQLTAQAALEAHEQGLERGTDQFNAATLAAFNRHLNEGRRQVERPGAPMSLPTPATDRDMGAIVSAPVSREAPSAGDGSRTSHGIRLTAEERSLILRECLVKERHSRVSFMTNAGARSSAA